MDDEINKFENYNPFSTAIKRGKLSLPTRTLLDKGLIHHSNSVLNFGCGFNEDGIILKNKYGFDNVYGYDKYNLKYKDEKVLVPKFYDIIICNYCLNVISDLTAHIDVLRLLKNLECNDTYLSVRCDSKAIRHDKWKYDEKCLGYWTSKTFQRFYDNEEIMDKLIRPFGEVEYIINNSSLKLFRLDFNK